MPDPGTVMDVAADSEASGSSVDPKIMAVLMRLPARQRQVVALRLILDLDIAQAAEVLGQESTSLNSQRAQVITKCALYQVR